MRINPPTLPALADIDAMLEILAARIEACKDPLQKLDLVQARLNLEKQKETV